MNIDEYIASGVVEAYLLGELPVEERLHFEGLLSKHPELRDELRLTERTLEELALRAARSPRVSLRNQLLELAAPSQSAARVVPLAPSPLWKWAAAASVVFALLSAGLALTYRSRWIDSQARLDHLLAQSEQLAQNYNVVNQKLDKIQRDVAIIENTAFQKVVMKGTPQAPSALAAVYWNASSKEVYLSIQNLKSLTADRQYQLWAIVDGKPVDAGVFDGGVAGLLKMKAIEGAVAFAVTVEPRGGLPAPTLETMQVMGSVTKS